MSTSTVDALVEDYLSRLRTAAAGLPPDRRGELLEEIEGHIADARAAGAAADEAAVRTLLDRLGPPEVIAAAAAEDDAGPAPVAPVRLQQPTAGLELAAVLMLTLGSLLPVVGWLVGVVLLWSSRRWRVGEKLLGSLVVPLGPGGVLYGSRFLDLGERCRTAPDGAPDVVVCEHGLPHAWQWALLALAVLTPFAVAVLLHRRARARAAVEPPRVVAGSSGWGGLEVAAVVLLGLAGVTLLVLGPLAPLLGVVGLVLVWASPRWTRREKAVATALTVTPVALAVLLPLGGVLVAGSA